MSFLRCAQRRQVDGDDVQPVEQVIAELAFLDLLPQIDVGGGDDAHVHLHFADAAEVHELAVLQDAQNLGLRIEPHRADLVEEQRAPVGHFEQALLAGDGAGKGALHVAEQR